ncbi:MAG: cytochrome c-type biogenesis protein [Candidatus Acidiferrum sp.]
MTKVKRITQINLRQGTAQAVPSIGTARFGGPEVRNWTLKRIAFLLLLGAFASAPLVTAQTGYSARAKEVGMHLKCMCKSCDMTAGGCSHPGGAFSGPCDAAKSMLKEVDQHLAKGESEQQIIDAFVAQYGTIVYVEPPKKGFGLVAWLMPIFYFLVGLAMAIFVVRKWRDRQLATAPAGPTIHTEALDRARAQAARETED